VRASLEVADIFRAAGPAYRAIHAGHLSLHQLKVMSAIEQCRTAALGGHVEACEDCGHQRIAYNSCLMGKAGNGELAITCPRSSSSRRQLGSPLRGTLQQRDQLVSGLEDAATQVWRHDRLHCIELFGRITTRVDLGGRQCGVAQP
jgi:Transposase zinc-binding domain